MFKFAYYPKASYFTFPKNISPRSTFRSDKLKIFKKKILKKKVMIYFFFLRYDLYYLRESMTIWHTFLDVTKSQ